jgi:RNase P subunit RPR2
MARKKEMDNLAKDAAAAKAAGMSYGRWKAMQENPVVIKKKVEIPETWKICPHCKKPFKPNQNGSKQIYCEISCQRGAQRERNIANGKSQEYYRRYKEKKLAEKAGAENG